MLRRDDWVSWFLGTLAAETRVGWMIWMKETSRGLEIKAKTMWSGHGQSGQVGPEILGFIDGLIKISI